MQEAATPGSSCRIVARLAEEPPGGPLSLRPGPIQGPKTACRPRVDKPYWRRRGTSRHDYRVYDFKIELRVGFF